MRIRVEHHMWTMTSAYRSSLYAGKVATVQKHRESSRSSRLFYHGCSALFSAKGRCKAVSYFHVNLVQTTQGIEMA